MPVMPISDGTLALALIDAVQLENITIKINNEKVKDKTLESVLRLA